MDEHQVKRSSDTKMHRFSPTMDATTSKQLQSASDQKPGNSNLQANSSIEDIHSGDSRKQVGSAQSKRLNLDGFQNT